LSDPLVFGAWLYENHCTRCHGPYENDRIATDYETERELKKAVENDRCQIPWGKRFGGELNNKQINAVVLYMRTWEQLDSPPELPELPPPPAPEIPVIKPQDKKEVALIQSPEKKDDLNPAVRNLIQSNEVAHGAFIYTRHCYRCHLAYEKNRMGKGFTEETVKRTVVNGKTSTQMKAFSRMKGGDLKNSEINAVVQYIMTWEKAGEPLAVAPVLLVVPDIDPAMFKPIGLPQFPPVKGNTARGERLYANQCTRCHGRNGQGYIGRSLSKHWGVIRKDLRIKSTIKQGVKGSPMPAWSQNSGGPLAAADLDDLVVFVKDLTPKP